MALIINKKFLSRSYMTLLEQNELTEIHQKSMARDSVVTREECLNMVSQRLGTSTTDLKLLNIVSGPLGSGTSGFMGDHLHIKVSVIIRSTGQMIIVHFFAKAVPTSVPEHRDYVLSLRAYEKEVAVYNMILPQLKKCLQQGSCSTASPVHWPESYLTQPEMIVLENLIDQGFSLHGSIQCLDNAHIVLVFKALAHLHAASLIFEEQLSSQTGKSCTIKDMYQDFFYESLYTIEEGSTGQKWFMNGIRAAMHIIEHLPKYGKNSVFYYEVKDKFPETCKRMWKLVQSSDKYRNVLCHGDLWNNNLLFRYEGETPVDVRFVDFQMVRYTPPAADLAFFLHMTTRRAFREQHEHSLLKLYHNTLSQELQLRGYDAEQLLSWTELEESYDRFKELGRINAVMCFQLCLMPGEYLAPLIATPQEFKQLLLNDRNKDVCYNFLSNPVYKDRMTEALEELIEFSVLKNDSI